MGPKSPIFRKKNPKKKPTESSKLVFKPKSELQKYKT